MAKCIIVYKEDYPWDVRVEKIANSLANDGNEVTIVCQNRANRVRAEKIGDLEILRLPRTDRLPVMLQRLANIALWFNPIWIRTLLLAIPKEEHAIIIVRDIPLVFSALFVKAMRRVKIVLDMAECYPEMYASVAQFTKRSIADRLLKNVMITSLYEKLAVDFVDHVLVMVEESRRRLLDKGISSTKLSIVSNTPPIGGAKISRVMHTGSQLRIVYVGFLTRIRGLDVTIRAVKDYLENGYPVSDVKIDIVGKGPAREELVSLVSELDLKECVSIHGWLDQFEVDNLISNANVGALTYRVCRHWNSTIPNKLFDYMAAGLPVLATEVIPIKRIVEEEECGVICKDQDWKDVAAKMVELRDPAVRQSLGDNGRGAIEDRYNWSIDEQILFSEIRSLDSLNGAS